MKARRSLRIPPISRASPTAAGGIGGVPSSTLLVLRLGARNHQSRRLQSSLVAPSSSLINSSSSSIRRDTTAQWMSSSSLYEHQDPSSTHAHDDGTLPPLPDSAFTTARRANITKVHSSGKPNRDENPVDMQQLKREIQSLAQAGQFQKAEELLQDFHTNHPHYIPVDKSDESPTTISDSSNKQHVLELQTLYNLILWGYARAKFQDGIAPAEAAERLFHRMTEEYKIPPTSQTYHYILECWSRIKSKKLHKQAGQQAEYYLRQLQSLTEHKQDTWAAYHFALKACERAGDGERAIRILHELIHQEQLVPLGDVLESGSSSTLSTPPQYDFDNNQSKPIKLSKNIVSTVLVALKSQPEQGERLLDQLVEASQSSSSNKRSKTKSNIIVRPPDVIHYSLVLEAWAKEDNGPRAEALFQKMMERGVRPNSVAYNALLLAWGKDLDHMEQIFQAMLQDYLDCPFRNGSAATQQQQRDISSLDDDHDNDDDHGYQLTGDSDLHRVAAVKPNSSTLSIVVTAYAQASAPERAEALLEWIDNDPRLRALVMPNLICWGSVINAWARARQPEKAEALLRKIQQAGYFEPNVVCYTTVLHAWAVVGNVERAQAIWDEMVHQCKLRPNNYSYNTLILAYSNARQPEKAHEWMLKAIDDGNVTLDVTTYGTVLKAWETAKQPQRARELLEEMLLKEKHEKSKMVDVWCFNLVLKAYSNAGMVHEAEALLTEMIERYETKESKIKPDSFSFAQVILANARTSEVHQHRERAGEQAEKWFVSMTDMGLAPDIVTINAMLHCLSTSGKAERAEEILRAAKESDSVQIDVVSYNTCLHAWARSGNAFRAEKLLVEMVQDHEKHSNQTKGHRPTRGKSSSQTTHDAVHPDTKSFTFVLLAWARQGSIAAAEHSENILRHMHASRNAACQPDTVAYNTVLKAWLTAAHKSRDVKVATQCAQRADALLAEMEFRCKSNTRVRPDHVTYVQLIRLWEAAKNQKRVQELRQKSQSMGSNRQQGWDR